MFEKPMKMYDSVFIESMGWRFARKCSSQFFQWVMEDWEDYDWENMQIWDLHILDIHYGSPSECFTLNFGLNSFKPRVNRHLLSLGSP